MSDARDATVDRIAPKLGSADAQAPVREQYCAPTLTRLGTLASLTQANVALGADAFGAS